MEDAKLGGICKESYENKPQVMDTRFLVQKMVLSLKPMRYGVGDVIYRTRDENSSHERENKMGNTHTYVCLCVCVK